MNDLQHMVAVQKRLFGRWLQPNLCKQLGVSAQTVESASNVYSDPHLELGVLSNVVQTCHMQSKRFCLGELPEGAPHTKQLIPRKGSRELDLSVLIKISPD